MMFALALGIDYALFIVVRFRAALHGRADEADRSARSVAAVGETMGTAGKAVAFSGVTVLVSLSTVLLVPSPAFRGVAVGIMLSVVAVLAATLTLLPAVLGKLGTRIDSGRIRLARANAGAPRSPSLMERMLDRWGAVLSRRPWLAGALVLVVLVGIVDFAIAFVVLIGMMAFYGLTPTWHVVLTPLLLVLVIIIIFPYLPGSKSPAFQGISIFVGVLLSLGSSSAVANAIAGIILTYMRSFAVGDWVRIGDALGAVVEKNMLVTRILTPKHEIMTIPNAAVMNGSVMNYTREAKNEGVIFHTAVTIGYDAPWRTVHQLLVDAACATEHVLHSPAPFVLQTALNDFYVAYELNAYTNVPTEMQFIYSHLHQNIQDRFNEAGVEICSPHFSSLRDGNRIAIPEQYVPPGYTTPGFRVNGSPTEEEQTTGKPG